MTKQMAFLASAILVSLLSMELLSARSGQVRAAEECLTRPGTTAPQGSHWYYRVDRTTRAHCWYLGPLGTKVASESAAAPAAKHPTESVLRLPTARPVVVPGETAYASAAPIETEGPRRAPEGEAGPSFAIRWLSFSPDTVARVPPSISSRDPMQAKAAMSRYAAQPVNVSNADGLPSPALGPQDRERTTAPSGPMFASIVAIVIGALLSMTFAMRIMFNRLAVRHLAQSLSRIRSGAPAATLTPRRLALPDWVGNVRPRDGGPQRYAPRRSRSSGLPIGVNVLQNDS
jgi:hypothetical protein